MIRTYAATLTSAAAGVTNVLNVGVPDGETWTLLEIRIPLDVFADTHVRIFLNDVQQYDLIPTVDNHEYVIGDQIVGPVDIRCTVEKLTATAQILGITLVVDQPLQP